MADFYQGNQITTLHWFETTNIQIEANSDVYKPVAVLIPIHAHDLGLPSVGHIAQVLEGIHWISKVVICIDHANGTDLEFACKVFSPLQSRATILHTNGSKVHKLFTAITAAGGPYYVPGKGSNICVGIWYLSAVNWQGIVAIHDADIVAEVYNSDMLSRLVTPVAKPILGLDFCKAYYARIHNKEFKGRITRLLFPPLLDAMIEILGPDPFFLFLREFRYILSGEISIGMDLAKQIPFSATWGYDLRLLTEIWRKAALNRIGQSPICDIYNHRHEELKVETLLLTERSKIQGISRMVVDIFLSLWQLLTDIGMEWNHKEFAAVIECYRRKAADYIQRYQRDSSYNGLSFNLTVEQCAVDTFILAAQTAEAMWSEGIRDAVLPSWESLSEMSPFISNYIASIGITITSR